MIQPPTNTIVKNVTSAEIEKYNTANKGIIDAGLVPAWIQSESAKKTEAEDRERQERVERINKRKEQINYAFDTANACIAAEYGLEPCTLYRKEIYSSSFRTGPQIGWTVEIIGIDKKCRVIANFGDADFELKLNKALRKLYQLAAERHKAQAEKKAAIEAAKAVLTQEQRLLIIKTADVEYKEPTFICNADGKISLKYKTWSSPRHSARGEYIEYTVGTFTPTAWVEWVNIKQQYARDLKELQTRRDEALKALSFSF